MGLHRKNDSLLALKDMYLAKDKEGNPLYSPEELVEIMKELELDLESIKDEQQVFDTTVGTRPVATLKSINSDDLADHKGILEGIQTDRQAEANAGFLRKIAEKENSRLA